MEMLDSVFDLFESKLTEFGVLKGTRPPRPRVREAPR
jgi:hypothetical protein